VPSGATTGPVIITVEGGASNAVTFGVGMGTVNGTVTQSGPGTPINGALVELLQNNVVQTSATTAANGAYSISNVAAGTYDVRFSKSSFGTVLSAANGISAGGSTTINAALPAPGTISGTVTKASGGTAIAGATVTMNSGDSGLVESLENSTRAAPFNPSVIGKT